MQPPTAAIRQAQAILKRYVAPSLVVDGKFGPVSRRAAAQWVPWTFRGLPSDARWIAAVLQKEARIHDIVVGSDAWYGPQTEDARRRLLALESGTPFAPRPDELPAAAELDTKCRNPSSEEFARYYGKPGANHVRLESPYPLKLDWDLATTITGFTIHKLCLDSARAAMEATLKHYGRDDIRRLGLDRFGGCFYDRLKRGGTTKSTHAWACAIDWFPSANTLKETKRTARFARPEYLPFMEAWDDVGWLSLGRCYDFDWMHVQKNPPR